MNLLLHAFSRRAEPALSEVVVNEIGSERKILHGQAICSEKNANRISAPCLSVGHDSPGDEYDGSANDSSAPPPGLRLPSASSLLVTLERRFA